MIVKVLKYNQSTVDNLSANLISTYSWSCIELFERIVRSRSGFWHNPHRSGVDDLSICNALELSAIALHVNWSKNIVNIVVSPYAFVHSSEQSKQDLTLNYRLSRKCWWHERTNLHVHFVSIFNQSTRRIEFWSEIVLILSRSGIY